jgi:hypothetical protein
MGTIVASLLAWVAYDAFVKRPESWGPLGLFVLVTTLAVIGDPLADLVIDGTVPVRSFEAAVIASFGPPDHIYYLPSYPTYIIFAVDHPITRSGLP